MRRGGYVQEGWVCPGVGGYAQGLGMFRGGGYLPGVGRPRVVGKKHAATVLCFEFRSLF